MSRALRNKALTARGTPDRRVRRIDQHTYLHCTKGVKRVRAYQKRLELEQVARAFVESAECVN